MPYWTGKQVGDFVIEEPIGRGGMSVVYSARQQSVARQVALKVIDLQPDAENGSLKRFTREAEVIAMLEHIHILPIFGYGVIEGEYAYFAMRLLRDGTLADALRRGAMPLDDALDLFTQIASGLQYMHSRGVIHRDLKPSNILLDENANAYLSDFGLAHVADASINFADAGQDVAGSPAYIAPEVIRGEGADHLSDIYSMGVILYQMLCGRLPFESAEGSVSAVLYKHVREKPPPPRQFNPIITPEIEAVILRALSKNPRERYPSANEMAYELRAAVMRPPNDRRWIERARRLPRLYGLMIACLCVALVVALLFLMGRRGAAATPMDMQVGERAVLSDLSLPADEIALARARLGTDGFIADFPCTLSDAYQTATARELSELAAQYNLSFRSYDSQDDPQQQITLIDQARSAGARAFILCPLNKPLLDESIRSLQDAAIPLALSVTYDSPYGIKIDLDNPGIGAAQGQIAGKILTAEHRGQGTVVLLTFAGITAGQDRAQGMQAGLSESAPNAEIMGPLDGYTRAQAARTIADLVAKGMHFDAILTYTDAGALGAIDALRAANLSPDDVFIVSANGEEPINAYVSSGYYVRASIPVNRSENAQLLMVGIVKALAGSPVPEFLTLSSAAATPNP